LGGGEKNWFFCPVLNWPCALGQVNCEQSKKDFARMKSVFRAFQGWEGTSPGEWRTRHRSTESLALTGR
jgi:hypothetical protein